MSGLNWTSYSYRNGEQHFGTDFFTGIGLPSYAEEDRKVYIKVSKWIPRLYVNGQEVSLDPYLLEGYEEITEWDNDKMEDVVVGRQYDVLAYEHSWKGEIEGYRFRIHRVMNIVDTEVVDPDGTTWTTRSGMDGFEEYCGAIPWVGYLYDVP